MGRPGRIKPAVLNFFSEGKSATIEELATLFPTSVNVMRNLINSLRATGYVKPVSWIKQRGGAKGVWGTYGPEAPRPRITLPPKRGNQCESKVSLPTHTPKLGIWGL